MSTSQPLDVLRLICDIQVAGQHPETIKKCLRDIVDATYESTSNTHELRNTTTHFELIEFVKQSINRSLRAQGIIIGRERINWLSVFYNRAATSIHQRLSAISPILPLYNATSTDPLLVVRRCIPVSHRSGTNAENLFGRLGCVNTDHLSDDLLHGIVSFLDLRQFFVCSRINYSWLNVVYRTDVVRGILERSVAADSLRCVLVDEPSESDNRPHPFISWQIRPCLSEWDFFTLQPDWLGCYVTLSSATISLQKRVDSGWISTDIVEHTAERPMNISQMLSADRVRDIYRLEINITAPFEWTLISEPRALGHLRYSPALLAEPLLWRRRFDQLYSMDDRHLQSALSSIALRENSQLNDVESLLLDPHNMRQIIHLMRHHDQNIRTDAVFLIDSILSLSLRKKSFFNLCTVAIPGRDAISIAVHQLLEVSENRHARTESKFTDRENSNLLILICQFMRAAGDLKHIAHQHSITIAPAVIQILRREIKLIAKSDSENTWLLRSKALWCLGPLSRARKDGETSRRFMRLLLDWERIVSTRKLDNKIKNDFSVLYNEARLMIIDDSHELSAFDGSISSQLIEHELDSKKYLVVASLDIISASLRSHPHLAKTYIRLELPWELYMLLSDIKMRLPKEDMPEIGSLQLRSPFHRYIHCIKVLNTVTAYREFFNLTTLVLDILCIYAKKATADNHKNSELLFPGAVGYLWRSLTYNPHHFEKALTKHKKFMQLLHGMYEVVTSDDSPYSLPLARAVSNLHNVLSDRRLFRVTFLSQKSFDDGEKECVCVCGSVLDEVKARDVGRRVVCLMCYATLPGKAVFYRCNTTRRPEHKTVCSYGLCFSCAKRQAFIHASEVEQ